MTGQVDGHAADVVAANKVMLASDKDRDAVAQRLQVAFAERRLTDEEFDQRIRAALTARTSAELDLLTADLPVPQPAQPVQPGQGRKPGRFAVAYKGSIRRSGRWPVPEHPVVVVYKGSGWLDLRAAELTAPVTTIRAIAYKSGMDIVLPPGVRVEASGLGVSVDSQDTLGDLRADAPRVRITGVGYKGSIQVITKPPVAGRELSQ